MKRTHNGASRHQAAQKKKFVMLGILLAGLGLIWGRIALQGSPRPKRNKQTSAQKISPTAAQATTGQIGAESQPTIEVDWPATLTRDLFRYEGMASDNQEPEATQGIGPRAEAALRSLTLQGTMLGDDSRALINGETVHEGDSVNGVTIRRIEQHHVIVEVNGIEAKLQL